MLFQTGRFIYPLQFRAERSLPVRRQKFERWFSGDEVVNPFRVIGYSYEGNLGEFVWKYKGVPVWLDVYWLSVLDLKGKVMAYESAITEDIDTVFVEVDV